MVNNQDSMLIHTEIRHKVARNRSTLVFVLNKAYLKRQDKDPKQDSGNQ